MTWKRVNDFELFEELVQSWTLRFLIAVFKKKRNEKSSIDWITSSKFAATCTCRPPHLVTPFTSCSYIEINVCFSLYTIFNSLMLFTKVMIHSLFTAIIASTVLIACQNLNKTRALRERKLEQSVTLEIQTDFLILP